MRRRPGASPGALLLPAIVLLLGIGAALVETSQTTRVAGAGTQRVCGPARWVGAWMAASQDSSQRTAAESASDTGRQFLDQSLRMIVTPTYGGTPMRLRLSNRFGATPVTFDAVHVGIRRAGAALVPRTNRAVTFGGVGSVTVPPGRDVRSDPVRLTVAPFRDLAISFHVIGPVALDVHREANQTQYATPPGSGIHAADTGGEAYSRTLSSWLGVAGVEVRAPDSPGALVALGDSITDGIGSTSDANARWTDQLARRLRRSRGMRLSVLNAGISGNQITRDYVVVAAGGEPLGMGPSAIARLGPDVLSQAGATDVLVFQGINDIFAPSQPDPAAAVVAGYQRLIEASRAAGLRVIGATLTPAAEHGEREAQRQAVNHWIRTSGAFDSVVDFDAAVRDPQDPARLAPQYAHDTVHLNDAGYRALADAVDLRALRPPRCR